MIEVKLVAFQQIATVFFTEVHLVLAMTFKLSKHCSDDICEKHHNPANGFCHQENNHVIYFDERIFPRRRIILLVYLANQKPAAWLLRTMIAGVLSLKLII